MSSIPPPNGIPFTDQNHGFDFSSLFGSPPPAPRDFNLPWDLQQSVKLPVNDPRLMRLRESSRRVNMPANTPEYPSYGPHNQDQGGMQSGWPGSGGNDPWALQQEATEYYGTQGNMPAYYPDSMSNQYLGSGEGSRGLSYSTHDQYQGGTQASLSGPRGMYGQAVSSVPPRSSTVASSSEPSPAPSGTTRDGVNNDILTEAPVLSTVQRHRVELDPAQTHMTHAGQLWIKDTVFRDLVKFLTTMNIEIPSTTPEDDECSICRLEYDRGRVGVKTVCGHWFCGACILEWFGMPRHSCPMCRRNLKKPPRRPARARRRGRAA